MPRRQYRFYPAKVHVCAVAQLEVVLASVLYGQMLTKDCQETDMANPYISSNTACLQRQLSFIDTGTALQLWSVLFKFSQFVAELGMSDTEVP